MKPSNLFPASMFIALSSAQQVAYGQCGGQGWTGLTTCISGYSCIVQSTWYSQCVPSTGSSVTTSTTKASSSTLTTVTTSKTSSTTKTSTSTATGAAATGFKWLGANEAGAEFGTAIPGVYGTDFIFASTAAIDTLMAEGYNIFRFPFMMERMAPGGVSSTLSAAYLANYSVPINHVTSKGGHAILDPHNYGRYNGAIITDAAAFKTFWSNLASAFKDNPNVIFDTNNEFHDEDISNILALDQAAIDGIRGVGATSQYIFAEGNSYSAAWFWNTTSDALKALVDPQDKLVYEMHLYLDSDNSGTSTTCYTSTVGVDRIVGATQWLRNNGKLGVLGEFAGGNNDVCLTAVKGLLQHMKDNSDVWLGALWWAAGPWWGDYIYSFEPPSGIGYTYYDATLKAFLPTA
ncbi:hypothetical protein BP5796_07774 [Coleophoma crateriformis]|uniref:cellulase n=1 Tax=Coleophoma crateriformis TaxID=565419 RepID=A0A3D8RCN8_9HELO|nr:hypothetical protein BP5796_07774 [Coleophoma crateriformis]